MMIRIKNPAKAERVRRGRGDKSPTETVNALIDEEDARYDEKILAIVAGMPDVVDNQSDKGDAK